MVLALMYVMYPIAYPTALLLDFFLGESHGTIYKKAGKFDMRIEISI
jgi:CBS domain containing-hemolysin-like protein